MTLYMGWKRPVEEDHDANLSAQLNPTAKAVADKAIGNLHWSTDTAPATPKLFLWGAALILHLT